MLYEAIVNTAIGTLYTGPQAECSPTDETLYGMKVAVLEENAACGRSLVRTHYRYEGWIRTADLLPCSPLTEAWEKEATQWVAQSFADVLLAPRIQALPVISVTRGARLAPVDDPNGEGWQKVRLADGREGYIRATLLMPYIAPMQVSDIRDEYEFRAGLISTAYEFLGTQYRWGGKSPLGLDCSGLCSTVYMQNGILIYRDAKIVEGYPIHPIPRELMQPGDLYFFPGHVAMYIDENSFIHSTSKAGNYGVVINSFNPRRPFYRPDLAEQIIACGSIF